MTTAMRMEQTTICSQRLTKTTDRCSPETCKLDPAGINRGIVAISNPKEMTTVTKMKESSSRIIPRLLRTCKEAYR